MNYSNFAFHSFQAYKGLSPSAGKKQKMYVFTSSDEGLCGRRLRKRETYLLVGKNMCMTGIYTFRPLLLTLLALGRTIWPTKALSRQNHIPPIFIQSDTTCGMSGSFPR